MAIKINFSGHPAAGFEIAPLVGANLPIKDGAELAAHIREILLSLPHREELVAGARAEIVLPGMSCAAGVLLAEWHGAFGSFPTIRWAIRTEKGFEFTEGSMMDLFELRNASRTSR